ncbi:M14 family metallopeptidase [Luteitalea sp.]|jgi:predicted deacylase|uniref:M14 family metallopeptidase n=1 Tax=Luteitalea sp. TaxID=2004800 RepID=UPI0037CAECFD
MPSRRSLIVVALLALLGVPGVARGVEPFRLGDLVVAPGSVGHGVLAVPAGSDGATEIPVSVIHGAQPGPVLALIAGVHGAEITPILALQAWAPRVDPAALRGTVVLVRVANVEAFLARSVRVNPVDRKNLNRVFPGRSDGSVTERIAHVLSTQVIPRADAVVDIHSGDAHEDLRPWTGYYAKIGGAAVIARSRAMAVAFGVPYVVEFPFAPRDEEPALYTGVVAVRRGIPAFDIEVGRLGNVEPDLVDLVAGGLDRLTRHLGMRDGALPPTPGLRFVRERVSVSAEATGIFHGRVRAGEEVAAGALIGEITDFHGRPAERVVAPRAGHVLFVLATPAVSRGEAIATIATAVHQEP